jgi:hypothetical protein
MEPQAWWAKATHFKPHEFASKREVDGRLVAWSETGLLMNMQFVLRLEGLRRKLNRGIRVTSGYRDGWHNKRVGGGTNSPHLYGRAADIDTRGWTIEQRRRAVAVARELGFTGIGVSATFLHLDDMQASEGFKRPLMWWYVGKGTTTKKPAEAWADVA